MDTVSRYELRQLDTHVAVAAYGWRWVKFGLGKAVVPADIYRRMDIMEEITGRETMRWLYCKDVPHFSTDRITNDLLVQKFNLSVKFERRPMMAYARSKIPGEPLTLKPVETPVDKMVTCWLISGGGISETNWDEELVGVCVHVLRIANQAALHVRE